MAKTPVPLQPSDRVSQGPFVDELPAVAPLVLPGIVGDLFDLGLHLRRLILVIFGAARAEGVLSSCREGRIAGEVAQQRRRLRIAPPAMQPCRR